MTSRGGSDAIVRAAIAQWMRGASIPNLQHVFEKAPFDLSGIDWDAVTLPGSTVRAYLVVFLDSDDDETVSWDGAGGRRVTTYEVALTLYFEDVSGDAFFAQDVLDDVIDGIKQRLRLDPALGTDQAESNIIQAAVAKLHVDRGRPERAEEGDALIAWTEIAFNVQSYEYNSLT